jgi:MFS transporter, putative metabolite:H+ symporter
MTTSGRNWLRYGTQARLRLPPQHPPQAKEFVNKMATRKARPSIPDAPPAGSAAPAGGAGPEPATIEDESTKTGVAASLVSGLGWLFDSYVINIYALVLPLIAVSFHASPARLGFIASLFLAGYAVGTIGFGLLTDHLGRKRSLGVSIGGYTLLTALTGLSPNIAAMGFLRFLTGIGGGGELPVGATLTSEMWPARRRGLGIGLMYVGYPLGYLLAIAAAFAAHAVSWRWVFILSIIPGALILLIRVATKESPRFVAVRRKMQEESDRSRGASRDPLKLRTILGNRLQRRHLLIGVLVYIPLAYCYYALSVFLPSYMHADLGLSYDRTLGYLAILTTAYVILAIAISWLSDIAGRRIIAIASAVVAGIGGVAMFSTHSLLLFMVIGCVAYPAWVGLTWTIGIAYVNEIFPTAVRGSGFGLSVGAGRIVSVAAPTIGGALAGSVGFGGGFKIAACLWILLIIGFFLGPETKGRKLEEIGGEEVTSH